MATKTKLKVGPAAITPGSSPIVPLVDTRPALGSWGGPGDYQCECRGCRRYFTGRKLSTSCADCAYRTIPSADSKSPDSDKAITKQLVTQRLTECVAADISNPGIRYHLPPTTVIDVHHAMCAMDLPKGVCDEFKARIYSYAAPGTSVFLHRPKFDPNGPSWIMTDVADVEGSLIARFHRHVHAQQFCKLNGLVIKTSRIDLNPKMS